GQPDRAAPSHEADNQIELDFDAYRLLNSCNAISKACEQTKLALDGYRSSDPSSEHANASQTHGSRSNHSLVPLSATRGGLLERRTVMPAFVEHANHTDSPRLVHPWQPAQVQAPTQLNGRRWLPWILSPSLVAAVIATAWWFGFVEFPTLQK